MAHKFIKIGLHNNITSKLLIKITLTIVHELRLIAEEKRCEHLENRIWEIQTYVKQKYFR